MLQLRLLLLLNMYNELIPIPKQAIGIHIRSCAHRMHDIYDYDGVLVQL